MKELSQIAENIRNIAKPEMCSLHIAEVKAVDADTFDELRDDVETYHCHITSTPNSANLTATVRHVTTSVTPD